MIRQAPHATDIRIRVLPHYMASSDPDSPERAILAGWPRRASDQFPAQGFATRIREDAQSGPGRSLATRSARLSFGELRITEATRCEDVADRRDRAPDLGGCRRLGPDVCGRDDVEIRKQRSMLVRRQAAIIDRAPLEPPLSESPAWRSERESDRFRTQGHAAS